MSTPDKYYTVSRTGNDLGCSCPDHQRHKSDYSIFTSYLILSNKIVVLQIMDLKSWSGKNSNYVSFAVPAISVNVVLE